MDVSDSFRILSLIRTKKVQLLILFVDSNTVTDTAKWSSAIPPSDGSVSGGRTSSLHSTGIRRSSKRQ